MWNSHHRSQRHGALINDSPTLEDQIRSLLDSAFAGVFSPAQEEHNDC